jgi:hypothetical protein
MVASSKGHDFHSWLSLLLFAWAPKDLATTVRLSAASLTLGSDKSNCRTSQIVHTASGAHSASFPMYNMGSFPGRKAAGTWV